MKTRGWLIFLCFLFAAGWLGGRNSAATARNAQRGSSAELQPLPGRTASATGHESARDQWAEKIGNAAPADVAGIIRDLPAQNRGAAIEAWLKSSGSLTGKAEQQKLTSLLDAWAEEDPDAALEWSANLSDPALREVAMTGVAGAVAESDPQRAFEHLIRVGEFRNSIGDWRLLAMMVKLSEEALAQSPQALADLWRRLPKGAPGVIATTGVDLTFPEGTDFRAIQEAMKGIINQNSPMFLGGLTGAWLKQDPEGATASVIENIRAGENVRDSWGTLYDARKRDGGKDAADRWGEEIIATLPDDARGKFMADTGFLLDETRIKELAQSSDGSAWITAALQSSADREQFWNISWSLKPLSEAQRIEFLKTLRGVKGIGAMVNSASSLNLNETQVAEIRKAIENE